MKLTHKTLLALSGLAILTVLLSGCSKDAEAKVDPKAEAPPPATVVAEGGSSVVKVDHPDQFPLATAVKHAAAQELNVNGVVSPDVSRQVAVPSLATGRVVEIHARLGDEVKKGQLLFKVRSNDIAGAYSDYQKAVKNQEQAVKNEQLTKVQQDRAKLLFTAGAVAKSAVEVADLNEATSLTAIDNAKVDTATAAEKLKLLGSDPDHPTGIVEVTAPVSGVVTDQQITDSSGVQALTPPNPFTISDLSNVWVVCDVYENDLAFVRIGDYADVKLNAYPDKVFKGRVSNIGAILDPNLRTAKVRLEMPNPGGANGNGLMRVGMFVTATFHGQTQSVHAAVPATAVLHLHDRDWIYVPAGNGTFRRVEVSAGAMLPGNMQEITTGIEPGQKVVSNALVMQNTSEQ